MAEYGEFSPDGLEYVIKRYDPPRPWINGVTNGRYCALISHTGGGYSFLESSGYNRLTRAYPAEAIISDRPGRYVYLRDADSGTWWSANWQPVQREPQFWECRHGLGYTVIRSINFDIESTITYFVPLSEDVEIWRVELRNLASRPRALDVFTYVEWCLGNYAFDLLETAFADLFNVVEFNAGTIYATKRLWNIGHRPARPHAPWDRVAFVSTNMEISSFDCCREEFLGRYRTLANPIAVERGWCSNHPCLGSDAVGVFHGRVRLDPGSSREFLVVVGAAGSHEEADALARRCRDPVTAQALWAEMRAHWQEYISKLWVKTPDPDFDLSVNVWNKYQAWFTSHWARMSSYYVGGGSIIGFRDSTQDVLGILPMDPGRARERLLYILKHQYRDGSCLHNWDPVTDAGPKTGHSDDPLWPVLSCAEYVRETGDFGFFDEVVEYYDGGEGSVYEHLKAGIEFTLGRLSDRGVALMGAADWNDGLDQVGDEGRGESVMVTQHLCWALMELAEIAARKGDDSLAERYRCVYQELKERLNRFFWDGEWYQRATNDEGEVLGSSKNQYGRIYLNPQSWAILSDTAPPDRAILAMDSAKRLLDTRYGPALFLPAYPKPDPKIGIITMFVPGVKENGTIFNHPVCWAIIAEAKLGRGDLAYEYWKKTSFIVRGREPDVYKAEPYVYAEYVYGPDSPKFGQGEFTWTTGTAPWMLRACVDWILGVRPSYEGLTIDPALPTHWSEARVYRWFRGAGYDIEIQNPSGVSKGIASLEVDGLPLEGNTVPAFADGKTHTVRVVLGRKDETERARVEGAYERKLAFAVET